MLKREKLLDLLKTRFDYYAAQAVYNEIVGAVGGADPLDSAALKGAAAFLAAKVPGTAALVERLNALAAESAASVAPIEAPVAAPEAPAAAPETPAEAPAEVPAADEGAKKKKKK